MNNVASSVSIVSRQNSLLEPITETEVLLEKSIITEVLQEEEESDFAESAKTANNHSVQQPSGAIIDGPSSASD